MLFIDLIHLLSIIATIIFYCFNWTPDKIYINFEKKKWHTIVSVLLFDQPYCCEFYEWPVIKRWANAPSKHETHSSKIIQRYCWIESWLHFTASILFSMLPTFEFNSLVISRNIHIDRSVFAYQHWRTFVLWSCKSSRRHSLVLFFKFVWSSCIAYQSLAFSMSSRELSFIY